MVFVLLLAGCVEPVILPPALPSELPPPPKRNGSIYQAGYGMQLYQDKTAQRVGDILTVRLEESNQGEYRAKTKTDKAASLVYPIPTFFGKKIPALETETATDQIFDSKGDSDQSDNLKGTVSVTVVQRQSNGNLVVEGESWITINQGKKLMRLRGIVRQEDIEPNNMVSSQRIANAQISYGAAGQAGYATNAGLLTKLFNRFALY